MIILGQIFTHRSILAWNSSKHKNNGTKQVSCPSRLIMILPAIRFYLTLEGGRNLNPDCGLGLGCRCRCSTASWSGGGAKQVTGHWGTPSAGLFRFYSSSDLFRFVSVLPAAAESAAETSSCMTESVAVGRVRTSVTMPCPIGIPLLAAWGQYDASLTNPSQDCFEEAPV